MPDYTLTYSENSNGWPSFYSYMPEYLVGLNNYLYSFSGGNIFQHKSAGLVRTCRKIADGFVFIPKEVWNKDSNL